MVVRPPSKSAMACEHSMPVRPDILRRISIVGIKKRPLLVAARNVARTLFPVLWKSMLPDTVIGRNNSDTDWKRSAVVPMATTSGSSRNTVTMCSAKIKPILPVMPSRIVLNISVKRYELFNREYFLAP